MPTPAVVSTLPQLFTTQDLTNRVSAKVLKQFTDDNKSGAPDVPVLQQITKDASSVVWSYLGEAYPLAEGDTVPDYLVKLGLDVGQAMVYMRLPQTTFGAQGFAMMDLARKDLQRLASGANQAVPPAGSSSSSSSSASSAASEGVGVIRSDRSRRTLW